MDETSYAYATDKTEVLSPIQSANVELDKAIGDASEALDALAAKLHSVLVFRDEVGMEPRLDSVAPLRSEQTSFTLALAQRVRMIAARARQLRDDIEL